MLSLHSFTKIHTFRYVHAYQAGTIWILSFAKRTWQLVYVVVVQALKLRPTLCNPMGYNVPGFPVLHYLPELAQIHVYWVSDAIWPSYSCTLLCWKRYGMHFIALSFKIHCCKKNPLENSKLKLWCLKWEQWIKWSFRNPIILMHPQREVTVIVRRIWTVKPPAEGRINVSYIPALSKGSAFPVSYSN